MNEKLLQYLWTFRLFTHFDFRDTEGQPIEIQNFGTLNTDAGPDFLFARIKTGGTTLAGHIELHVRSSDWIFHGHTGDPAYDNVILHVVYQCDTTIEVLRRKGIPTLELKDYLAPDVLKNSAFLTENHQFIPCEKLIGPRHIPFGFEESSLLNKLNSKSIAIQESLHRQKNDYEAVLFHQLAYAFGLKINAEIFLQLSESVPYSVVRKIRQNRLQLEALLFGLAGFLADPSDEYQRSLANEYRFIQHKYGIGSQFYRPKFLRLRPPNFPTVRLSQLAAVLHRHPQLFSRVISAQSVSEITPLFENITAHDYWDSHYTFGKAHEGKQPKMLTRDFVEILMMNAVLPFRYSYMLHQRDTTADEILGFYSQLPPEKNTVITSWKSLGIPVKSALSAQAFLYHYKNFCIPKNCLNCSIGFKILKENVKGTAVHQ